MASLDNIEGDLIEGGVLAVLVVFVVALIGIYRGLGKLDPVAAFKQALASLGGFFQTIKDGLSIPVSQLGGTTGAASVHTGSNGEWGASDEERYQSELLDALDSGQMTLGEYAAYSAPVGGN